MNVNNANPVISFLSDLGSRLLDGLESSSGKGIEERVFGAIQGLSVDAQSYRRKRNPCYDIDITLPTGERILIEIKTATAPSYDQWIDPAKIFCLCKDPEPEGEVWYVFILGERGGTINIVLFVRLWLLKDVLENNYDDYPWNSRREYIKKISGEICKDEQNGEPVGNFQIKCKVKIGIIIDRLQTKYSTSKSQAWLLVRSGQS